MNNRFKSFALAVLLPLGAFAAEQEILGVCKWQSLKASGAEGTMTRQQDGTFLLEKTNDKGLLFFYNPSSDYKLTPGKVYRIGFEFKGEGNASMMLQTPGSKRTPFPTAMGKDGAVELSIIAQPDETKARLHLLMSKPGKLTITRAFVEESDPADNLLLNPAFDWRKADILGAKSTMKKTRNKYVIDCNAAGNSYVAFVPGVDLDIKPGKNYLVTITAKRFDTKTAYNGMMQMPGGKRTPYPGVPSKGLVNESETLRYIFTARPDETKLRPHLIIRGKGKVEIEGVSLKELSDEEMKKEQESGKVTAMNFKGSSLRTEWTPVGATVVGGSALPFVEVAAGARGGISCDNLKWEASKVRAVEVDFRAVDEGGYLECGFDSTENGKNYNAYYGISVLPDGKWHRIMFPVAEEPAWRGTITRMQFVWGGKGTKIAFREINATPVINRITDLRPRGIYKLSRLAGGAPAAVRFLDRNYREIGKVGLPAGTASKQFTVPALCMTTVCEPAGAPLLAELLEMPKLDRPAAYWRGAWIWCWNGFGPNASNVWFKREFELSEAPSDAALVCAGDDNYELFLNGKSIGRGFDWSVADRYDVAKYLRPGKNTLVVRVYNAQAWGGLLCDLYYSVGGKANYIVSDASWNCHVGGDAEPAQFERPVMVLGAPPVAPWNSRVGYVYVGPKGKVEVLNAGVGEFTAKVLAAPAIDSNKLEFTLQGADGRKQAVTGSIAPSTGKWRAGSEVRVKFTLPPQFAAAEVFNASAFLEVADNAKLATVKVLPHKAPAMVTARIEGSGGRPYFVVNGEKRAPIYFLLGGGFGQWPATRDWMIRNAADAGCDVLRFGTGFEEFWKSADSFDFQELDRRLETVVRCAPDAKCIINLNTGMPLWWLKENPDDATVYFGNKPPHVQKDRQALASKHYLKDARIPIRALVAHLRRSPFADKVIGIALSEGWNSEWFWSFDDNNSHFAMAGYSPADHATFRSYLRERYKSDAALQKAWKMPGVTLDSAPMPTDKDWNKSSVGLLLDPEKDMQLIDWFRFRNRSLGEAITELGKMVKEETGGKWLTGVYYGYLLAFSNIYNRLQTVGHLDFERVARSPYIDFVTAPSFYTWRLPGESDAIMQAAESFTSHGKLIIVEQDLRTYSEPSTYEIRNSKLCTPEQSVGAIDRAVALTMTRGVGTHWFEMYESWFREPLLLKVMLEGKRAYEALGPVQGTTPVEVALVSDPESAMYTKINAGDGLHVASIGEMQRRFAEAAVPFRHVTLHDLMQEGLIPPQKFYVVNNLLRLNAQERAALMKRFEREKATVLWLYAAGLYENGKGPSVPAMNRFLGINFALDRTATQPRMTLIPGYGVAGAVNFNHTAPWFVPVSGFSEVIGKLPDGRPALVKWKRKGVTHYFSTLMNLPPQLVQALADKAGVHVYARTEDPVLVGNDVVALHAKTDGLKSLTLRPGTRMKAVLGPVKGEFRSGEKFPARAGQTYVFHVVRD